MTVSFRSSRYLVALLWSWSLPLIIGGMVGSLLSTWQVLEIIKASDEVFLDAFDTSIRRVTESCSATHPEPTSRIDHSSRSDPSADLVSQHWREAASLWVARRAQGETLTKRRTDVQSEGASKRLGPQVTVTWGSAKREGEPLPSVARMCKSEGAVNGLTVNA